jgi:hypothetical protein
MAEMLENLGFNVTLKTNSSLSEMESSVRSFGDSLLQGSVGLFYYSGHGIQVGGSNYLIPVDSNIQREDDFAFVEGGSFSIGSSTGEGDEWPEHNVRISSFYTSKYEVINDQAVDILNYGIENGYIFIEGNTVKNSIGNREMLLDLDYENCDITYGNGTFSCISEKKNNPF